MRNKTREPNLTVRKIKLNGRELAYELERKHVKNINVRIKPDRVHVSAGKAVPVEYIDSFLISKGEFILRALDKYSKSVYTPMKGLYEDGEALYILGKLCCIELRSGRNSVLLEREKVVLSVEDCGNCALRQKVMDKWLRELCAEVLERAMGKIYPAFKACGVKYPQIRLRRMVSRWGSCMPSRGIVTFNTALIHVPEKCIEYVAAHELAHFLHADHSKNFYEKLSTVMSDWKERKALLEQYGEAVIIRRNGRN